MFEKFRARFVVDPVLRPIGEVWRDPDLVSTRGYEDLAGAVAGASFNGGLYRFHDSHSGPRGQALLNDAFPAFAQTARPFAYDWLGRQFALDLSDRQREAVLLFEPDSGEVLEIPATFVGFHEDELVDHSDAALATEFFAAWCAVQPAFVPLGRDQCVGHRIPLFLGGPDEVTNLELTDLEVQWSLFGQLRQSTSRLTPGTIIGEVSGEN